MDKDCDSQYDKFHTQEAGINTERDDVVGEQGKPDDGCKGYLRNI